MIAFHWDWLLEATPEQLWPLVSDTNRINLLASMAPASFTETPNPEGGSDRTGNARQLGLGVAWDEHPFEWVYPHGFSVLREFHNGVLRQYRSSVTLTPEGSGTRLVHRVELEARIALMAPFVEREGPKQQRNWDHAYRAIDAYVMGTGPYPFSRTAKVKLPGAAKELAAEIEVDSPDPELERKLFSCVMGEHEHELCHLRPFLLADRWRASREALLGLCAYAVRRKLLIPQWSLLCPHCRGAKGTAARPEDLASTVFCNSCNISFGRVSDDLVELTFRPNPTYRKVQEATYCVGGPGSQPHVLFQARLLPGAGRDVSLSIDPGRYRLRGPRIAAPLEFNYFTGDEVAEELPVFEAADAGFTGPEADVQGPKLRLRLINTTNTPQDLLIETRDWRDDATTLARVRALAADDAVIAQLLA
ncbi:MAG: pknB 21 [Cyanobacteria bacterium RYN_339]|nr:pknB 21 [Cyanobacteria bacterium RYN_339]